MSTTYLSSKERQCDGKVPFFSKSEAKKQLRRAQSHVGGGAMTVYECPHCSGIGGSATFHIGHSQRWHQREVNSI